MKLIHSILLCFHFYSAVFVHCEEGGIDDAEPMHCSFQAGPVPHNQALGVADLQTLETALIDAFNEHSSNIFRGSNSSNTNEPGPLLLKSVEVTGQKLLEVEDDEGRRELQWLSSHFPWSFSYLKGDAATVACRLCGNDSVDRRHLAHHRLRSSSRGLGQNPGVARRFREKLKANLEYFADTECVMVECDGLKFDATPECF